MGDVVCGRGAKTVAVPDRCIYWEMSALFCWCSALLPISLAHGQYSEYLLHIGVSLPAKIATVGTDG